MKIVILFQQIILEKFATGKWFMLEMEEYTFMFKMVNKTKNLGSERVAGLTPPLIACPAGWVYKQSHGKSRAAPKIMTAFAFACVVGKNPKTP